MKKYEYTKTFLDHYKGNEPIFRFEKGIGYRERIFTSTDNVGETFEFDVFFEKIGKGDKYNWQATHASTGLLLLYGRTYTECADDVVAKAFSIYKLLTDPKRKAVYDKLRDLINYVPKDTIEK